MKAKVRFVFVNRFGEIRSLWAILALIAAASIASNALSLVEGTVGSFHAYVQRIVAILVTVGLWKLLYRKPLNQFGFVRDGSLRAAALGFAAGAIGVSLVFGILLLTGSVSVQSVDPGVLTDGTTYLGLILALLVGIAEETQFRGYAMGALKSTRNRVVVIAGSSVWFMVAHVSNPGFGPSAAVGLVVGGIFFAYVFMRSGTLFIGMFFHAAWDFFEWSVFGMGARGFLSLQSRTGDPLLGSPAFGIEGGLVSIVFFIVATVLVHFFIRNRNGQGFVMPPERWRRAAAGSAQQV